MLRLSDFIIGRYEINIFYGTDYGTMLFSPITRLGQTVLRFNYKASANQ